MIPDRKAWRLEKEQFLSYVISTLKWDRTKVSVTNEQLADYLWRDYKSRVRASYGNGYRACFIAGVKEGARQ